MVHGGKRAGRGFLLSLLTVLGLLVGLVVGVTPARAVLPVAALPVLAPSIAAQVYGAVFYAGSGGVVSSGVAAVGAAGASAATVLGTVGSAVLNGAATTAAVCLFTRASCSLPNWGQNPNVAPNADQPATFTATWSPGSQCGSGTAWVLGGSYDLSGAFSTRAQVCPTYGNVPTLIRLQVFGPYTTSESADDQPLSYSNASRPTDVQVTGVLGGARRFLGQWSLPTTQPLGGTRPNPERPGQPFRTFSVNGGPEQTIYGQGLTYTEAGSTRPPAILPELPEGAVPLSAGIVTPLTVQPPGTITQGKPQGTPVITPTSYPNTLPECPTSGSCTVGRPVPGVVYSPAPNPDGTPGPTPEVAPGDQPCVFGAYLVPEGDCTTVGVAMAPAQTPAPAPSPAPSGFPAPQYPEPNPTRTPCGADPNLGLAQNLDECTPDGPDDAGDPDQMYGDGYDCTGGTDLSWNPVTWVYVPVRCALVWAFVPPQGLRDRLWGLDDTLATKTPQGYVFAVESATRNAASGAAGECFSGPVFRVTPFELNYAVKPIDMCPGSFLGDNLHTVRPALTVALWLSMLVPLGMWVFRQTVPVIGGGDA